MEGVPCRQEHREEGPTPVLGVGAVREHFSKKALFKPVHLKFSSALESPGEF